MAGATLSGIGNGSQCQSRLNPQDFLQSVASAIASQPLLHPNAKVWGVLTAISCNDLNRMRPQNKLFFGAEVVFRIEPPFTIVDSWKSQSIGLRVPGHVVAGFIGINVLLTSDEHVIGRTVINASFKISSSFVSPNQCKIYRKRATTAEVVHQAKFKPSIFLKDTSTNGTYLNWKKLRFYNSESKLHHGDIISFAPQHELAYAFVFREVLKPTPGAEVLPLKRKTVECGPDSKRLKGLGASEGSVFLSDFRSPERSNTELQKQLDDQLVTTDSLDSKNMAAIEHREKEKKDIEKSVSESCIDQPKDLQQMHMEMPKEAMEVNKILAYEIGSQEDRIRRLADEIMNQEASVSQPKKLLDMERAKRQEENALISELEARLEEKSLRKEGEASISELETLLGWERTMRKCEKAYMSQLKVQLDEERAQRKGQKASITELEAELDEERARRKEEKSCISELKTLLGRERAMIKEEKVYRAGLKAQLDEERTGKKESKASMSEVKALLDEESAWRKEEKTSTSELTALLVEERARRKEEQASISELNALLDEERAQRKEEKEKFAANLEASKQRARTEALEELKLLSDAIFGFFDLRMCMDSKLPSDKC